MRQIQIIYFIVNVCFVKYKRLLLKCNGRLIISATSINFPSSRSSRSNSNIISYEHCKFSATCCKKNSNSQAAPATAARLSAGFTEAIFDVARRGKGDVSI
jgi:hypothetical protein